MKLLIRHLPITMLLFISITFVSCKTSFWSATLGNRNVYKTKTNLSVKMVYEYDHTSTDKDYILVPNVFPAVIKTAIVTTTQTATTTVAPVTSIVTNVTTIPPTTTRMTTNILPPGSTVVTTPISSSVSYRTSYTLIPPLTTVPPTLINHYIRYKVVADDGDYKYIKVLPGCHIEEAPADTLIKYGASAKGALDPSDCIFQVSKKALLPNTHYLASSALIGKIMTLPVRVRREHWNDDNTVLQGSLSIGYCFGYKLKLGNNPYQPHYINFILYGAGISQQKHFSLTGKDPLTGKEGTSATKDEFAVTYLSFGAAYEFDKFNIGVFMGKDKMFGILKNWAYQDSWWWGIGLGYELFK